MAGRVNGSAVLRSAPGPPGDTPGPLWLSKHLGLEKQATAWQAQQQQLSTQVGILTEQYAHITEDYKKLAELLAQA